MVLIPEQFCNNCHHISDHKVSKDNIICCTCSSTTSTHAAWVLYHLMDCCGEAPVGWVISQLGYADGNRTVVSSRPANTWSPLVETSGRNPF